MTGQPYERASLQIRMAFLTLPQCESERQRKSGQILPVEEEPKTDVVFLALQPLFDLAFHKENLKIMVNKLRIALSLEYDVYQVECLPTVNKKLVEMGDFL